MDRPMSRVSRVLVAGPLAPFAAVYAVELKRRGYTRRTSVNQLRQVARLSLWVEASGLTLGGLTGERIDEFLAVQRATGRHRASWSRPGLVCLLDVLSGLGVLQAPASTAVDSPTDALLGRFERYLLSERGLAVGTVRGYVSHARRFVGGLSRGGDLGRLTAAEVTASVLREAAAGSVSAAQNFVAGLRAFLRFCFLEGLMDVDGTLTLAVFPQRGGHHGRAS